MRLPIAAALFPLLVLAGVARAETVDASSVALGRQTEQAAEVAIVTAESESADEASRTMRATLRVEESLRGGLAEGSSVAVERPARGAAAPWEIGRRYLAFLAPAPPLAGAPARFELVSGPFGLRPLSASGPEARFPGIVREIAATLDASGRVREPDALRALLVRLAADEEPGIAWSGATDLVRHEELHAGLTAEDRARILAAYRACPIGKATKGALAFAVAVARQAGAAAALADTLTEPRAETVRGAVAEALRRLGDPASPGVVEARLAGADAAGRKNLLVALGAVGGDASVPAVRRALADDDGRVRAEAARALGLISRSVREADATARVEGLEDLSHLHGAAKSDDERVAALWALAQLDTQAAWAVLRRVAADEAAPQVSRKAAERYLTSPRVSLLLE